MRTHKRQLELIDDSLKEFSGYINEADQTKPVVVRLLELLMWVKEYLRKEVEIIQSESNKIRIDFNYFSDEIGKLIDSISA